MNYEKFSKIMKKHLFKDEKLRLLEKIAEAPERFIGKYRATSPNLKLEYFILQSKEIRFGNGLEEVIEEILKDRGYVILDKVLSNQGRNKLKVDQYFCDRSGNYYFIEQKVRDDHDTSKRDGQINNFRKKYDFLIQRHGNVIGIMYFIDSSFTKNKNYYQSKLEEISEENIKLFYGKEFFEWIEIPEFLEEFEEYFERWSSQLPTEIDFSFTTRENFDELKKLEGKYWKKLVSNEKLWEQGIIKILFPTSEILVDILDYFENEVSFRGKRQLCEKLRSKIERYYLNDEQN